MTIDPQRCSGCGKCIPYCPTRAIIRDTATERVTITEDECVECGTCLHAGVCPSDALVRQELTWPRILRRRFSNPLIRHPRTGVAGRGTEEMKTNDVTGRLQSGMVALTVEMGRPGVGARFRDAEKVTMALSGPDVQLEPDNPVTHLVADTRTGRLRGDVLDEKVLSAIVEVTLPTERLRETLEKLRRVSAEVDTVFSVGLACRLGSDGAAAAFARALEAGFTPSPNGKTNVGLGRPAFEKRPA